MTKAVLVPVVPLKSTLQLVGFVPLLLVAVPLLFDG
jgi:hypothetical protein